MSDDGLISEGIIDFALAINDMATDNNQERFNKISVLNPLSFNNLRGFLFLLGRYTIGLFLMYFCIVDQRKIYV